MDDSTKTMMLTLASGVIKKGLITLGATAATHGIISANQTETFVAVGMFAVGAAWSFWNDYGRAIVLSKLEVLKAQSLAQAAKLKTAGVAAPSATEIAAQHPTLTPADVIKQATIVKVLLMAFALSLLAFPGLAMAQTPRPRPLVPAFDLGQKIHDDIAAQNAKAPAIVNGTSTDPNVSCDFKVFLGLTPQNLEATIKKCLSDANSTLVEDTQRALDSAKAYTQTGASAPTPDNDAINCLTPGLAILKAGVIVPAVAEVKDASGNVTTPGVPAKNPGLILLFQKYREFVLAGGLTSCKTWVDTAVNATATQAINNAVGIGVIGAGAALLAPK